MYVCVDADLYTYTYTNTYVCIYIYMTNAASHTTGRYNGGRQQNGWCVIICADVCILKNVYV